MTGRARTFVFVLLLAVGFLVIVFAHGTSWRGEWNFTMDTAIGVTVLTGPIVGAFACWTCAEERRRAALVDSTPRGWMAPLRSAASATLVGIAAFLVGLLGAFLATATVTHGGPLDWWMALMVIPVLASNAVLGAVVGRLWPIRVLVVLVAPGLFLLSGLPEWGIGPQILRQGLSTGTLAGQTWKVGVVIGQAVVMVALLISVAALLAAAARVHTRIGAAVAVAGVAVAWVAGSPLPSDYDDQVAVSGERPTACAGSAPRVCLAPSNRRALARISKQMRRAAAPLIEAGADVPDVYAASLPRVQDDMDSGVLVLGGDVNTAPFPLWEAVNHVSFASPCSAWSSVSGPTEDVWEARDLVADWVSLTLSEPRHLWSAESDEWLKTTPAQQQEEVIVDLFDKLRACELDQITLPWKG